MLLQDDRCKLKPLLNQMDTFIRSLSTLTVKMTVATLSATPILHVFVHFAIIFLRADQDV